MSEKYKGLSYQRRLKLYEEKKREIYNSCFDYQEYEEKIKKLIVELGI